MSDDLTTSKGLWAHRDDVQILDVREPYEWDAGRIEGSVHVPLASVMAGDTGGLDTDRPVVVVCRSGNRSELAMLMLQARGYEAYNLGGGVVEWTEEGLPFSTPQGDPGTVA